MNLTIKNSQLENISYCVCLHTCLVCSCTHERSSTYSLIVPLSSDVTGCCNYLWPVTSRQWFLQDTDRERQPPLLSSTLRRSKWISKYLPRTSRSCVARIKGKISPCLQDVRRLERGSPSCRDRDSPQLWAQLQASLSIKDAGLVGRTLQSHQRAVSAGRD